MNGSIIIPEKFALNKKNIRVIIDNEYCTENNCIGEADFTEKVVTLCSKFKGQVMNKKMRETTYYHELVHMILDSMGREKLKYDEKFVDLFAARLYEYEKTKQ